MFRKLLILVLGMSVPMALGAACDDKDHGDDGNDSHGDDGSDDGSNDGSDDGNDSHGGSGQSDSGQSDSGQSDSGQSDSGQSDSHGDDGSAQCQSPDDCPIIHCNCESGIVNYTNCDNGKCGTESDCPDVCADFDMGNDESDGGSDSGGW